MKLLSMYPPYVKLITYYMYVVSFLPTALFPDKRIKFTFGWDNGIKFNFSIWLTDKRALCRCDLDKIQAPG